MAVMAIAVYIGLILAIKSELVHSVGTLLSDCACYGNDVTIDSVMPNCTSSNGRIYINSVYRAAKPQNLGCPDVASAGTRDEAKCCTYQASDCKITVNVTQEPTIFSTCTGAVSCSRQVTWQPATSCSNNFMTNTNYMCVDYYCFEDAKTIDFCDTTGKEVTTPTSYFYNDGYPTAISHSGCCACIVSPGAASATVDIFTVDLQLYDKTATCLQNIFITEGTTIQTYNCTINNDFTLKKLWTANGTVTVTLKSDTSARGHGKAWFKAVVSNGALSTTCSAVRLCPDETATTTTTTPDSTTTTTAPDTSISVQTTDVSNGGLSTTCGTGLLCPYETPTTTFSAVASNSDSTGQQSTGSETSTNPQSKEETWLFGLSIKISAIMLAGLFLILLLLFLLFCLLCYHHGKSKAYNLSQSRPKPIQESIIPRSTLQIPPSTRHITPSPPPYSVIGSDVMLETQSVSIDHRSDVVLDRQPVSADFMKSDRLTEYYAEVPRSKYSGMFVYRPFENRSQLRSYSRRTSLPRVDSP